MNCNIIFIALTLIADVASHNAEPSLLLLVSFDGFRYDYLDMAKDHGKETPNFKYLIENGVSVESPGMTNAFDTVTFPNHFTIVTGMYEETHGVVGNYMFDPTTNDTFTLKDAGRKDKSSWFHNGTSANDPRQPEPIWITNEKNEDRHRHSGIVFWPGSEVPYKNNMFPLHYETYNRSFPNESRIERMISWFTADSSPINLGLLYFNEPDHYGHGKGPNSPGMIDMIIALDGLVGCLISRLKDVNLFERTNIIITSDHGMEEVRGIIEVDTYLNANSYQQYGGSAVWNILPKDG